MRPFQIFAAMSAERCEDFLSAIAKESPAMFQQALAAAGAALRMRPTYLKKQPLAKQASAIRRTLARVAADPVAEELIAVYFLQCRKNLLVDWLDAVEVAHDDGTLQDSNPPQPEDAKLRQAVQDFRAKDADPDRELLLRAYSAQSAIQWPILDELVDAQLKSEAT